MKNAFDTNSCFFQKKYGLKKETEIFDRKVYKLQRFQCFDQCWWKRPILEGSLIQKPN